MPDLAAIPGLDALRRVTLGNDGTRIAFLDGPVDTGHACFAGASFDVISADRWSTNDEAEGWALDHATMVASVVVGQPGTAVEGVAPGVHATFVEAMRDEADASFDLTLARIISMVLDDPPDIMHVAHCLPSQSGAVSDLLLRALQSAEAAGVLVVAPCGNDAGANRCSPADQPNVLAVGGLDDDGSVRDLSNHGPAYDGHGVMAWAQNLQVAKPGGGTRRENGTSGAAPQVSAVAGLLLSAARARGLAPRPLDVGRIIRETAKPLAHEEDRRRAIGGVLDPEAAMHALLGDRVPASVASGSTDPMAPQP